MDSTTKGSESTTQIFNFTTQNTNDNSVLGAFYLVVSILVMVANGVVVSVIAKTRELHLPTLWMIAHMAVWDFLHGLLYLVISVPSAFLNRFAYPDRLIGWASSIHILIVGQNLFNTAMVVVDRYIALKYPLKYPTISTKERYFLAVLVSYLLNTCRLLMTILPGLNFRYGFMTAVCVSEFSTVGGQIAFLSLLGITFIVIIVCSFMMLLDMIRGGRRVRPVGPSRGTPEMFKFSLMTTLTAAVYCSAYLPIAISAMIYFIVGANSETLWLSKFSFMAVLSNSLWNVFIYMGTYQPFREALLSMFCKTYHRRRRQADIQATFRTQARNVVVTSHV